MFKGIISLKNNKKLIAIAVISTITFVATFFDEWSHISVSNFYLRVFAGSLVAIITGYLSYKILQEKSFKKQFNTADFDNNILTIFFAEHQKKNPFAIITNELGSDVTCGVGIEYKDGNVTVSANPVFDGEITIRER